MLYCNYLFSFNTSKMTTIKGLAETNLFKPIKVGDVELTNRLVYAPTTRYRATKEGLPTDAMAKYYGDRAEENGGLLIIEATTASSHTGRYYHTPSFASKEEAEHWRPLVEKVHANGSKIAIQLWGLGRVADPVASKAMGSPMIGASKIYMDEESEKACIEAGNELKEMTQEDIDIVTRDYVEAAKNAVNIGIDIVEVHGAHGYLFDQFIRDTTNHRTDKYGGSIENRARFVLDTLDGMIEAVGASKVAIRLSPYQTFQGSGGVDAPTHPIAQFGYIYNELEKRAKAGNRLAYISFVEPVVTGIANDETKLGQNPHWMEEIWTGIILRSGNYLKEPEKLIANVNLNDRTLIGTSRYYTSNPDLAYRLKNGLELTSYDRPRFYNIFENWGYNTWGKYGVAELSKDSEIAKKVPKAL